jgi:hypothetical protein
MAKKQYEAHKEDGFQFDEKADRDLITSRGVIYQTDRKGVLELCY